MTLSPKSSRSPSAPKEAKQWHPPTRELTSGNDYLRNKPAFSEPLLVGKPTIPDRKSFFNKVEAAFDRSRLSNIGPWVEEFEASIAHLIGVPNVIAVSNGTVGIELVARALDLTGNVIIPSFTYVATAHALAWHGITPKFCDIDFDSHNLDPRQVEGLIDENTSAILGVHLWGRPCAIDQLQSIAERNNLRLVFDAAHAFGCSYRGGFIGSFGDAEIFSFHATKYVSTFEGGAIATQNNHLAAELRQLRNFGFDENRITGRIGINAKMNEISACFGLTSMENRQEIVAWNRQVYQTYRNHLARIPGIKLIDYSEKDRPNFQYVIVEVNSTAAGITADELARELARDNIYCQRYFVPACHRLPPYASTNKIDHSLTNTETLEERVLALPAGAQCTTEAVELICNLIGEAVKFAH